MLEKILDLYRAPRHRGHLASPTHRSEAAGKVCGDRLALELAIDGDKIADARFSGACCAVTTAGASLLLDRVIGLNLAAARALTTDEIWSDSQLVVPRGRRECAELPVEALAAALAAGNGAP